MVELDFWQMLTIVLSPIIIGAISTHVLSRSWQKYQQKITMKQELINLYSESIVSLRFTQILLIYEINSSISIDIHTTDELSEQGRAQAKISFPKNPQVELYDKFQPQYIELKDLVSKAGIKRSLLRMRLKLYTDDDTFETKLKELAQNNIKHRIAISKLINSKDSSEFKNTSNEINKITDEFTEKSKVFSTKLVKTKIKDIVV